MSRSQVSNHTKYGKCLDNITHTYYAQPFKKEINLIKYVRHKMTAMQKEMRGNQNWKDIIWVHVCMKALHHLYTNKHEKRTVFITIVASDQMECMV